MVDYHHLFRIDHRSKLPLYELIAQNIRELILSGQLKVDESLPPELELASFYNVSRLTVRRATDELARQGWILRQRGVGTFIGKPLITHIAPSKLSFTEQMRAIGRVPSSRVVSIQVLSASEEVAGNLEINPGEPVVEIMRVRLADGEPILLETTYLSRARFPGLESVTGLDTGSLYEHLSNQYDVNVVIMDQTLEPVLLNTCQAQYLELDPRTPAILSEIIAYSSENQPIEYSRSVSSGEKCKFYFRFRRGENTENMS